MNSNDMLEMLKTRRSYRLFEDKQITDEELDMILEAGLYAPNAGSRQSAIMLVTQDKAINHKLGAINRQAMIIKPGNSVNTAQPSIIDNPDAKSAFYDAPTVITLLAPRDFIHSEADCAMVASNIILMAHSLGIGSCVIARAGVTMASEYGNLILESNNIDNRYKAYFHVVLGYGVGDTLIKERKQRIYKM